MYIRGHVVTDPRVTINRVSLCSPTITSTEYHYMSWKEAFEKGIANFKSGQLTDALSYMNEVWVILSQCISDLMPR